MNEIVMECKNLCKNYSSKIALRNVNLSLKRGRVVGLLGPNGERYILKISTT